jgi:hypothetical protein
MQVQGKEGIVQVRQGSAARRATGEAVFDPNLCTFLAGVSDCLGHTEDSLQALIESQTLVEQHEERVSEAEIPSSPGRLAPEASGGNVGGGGSLVAVALDVARDQQMLASMKTASPVGMFRGTLPHPITQKGGLRQSPWLFRGQCE